MKNKRKKWSLMMKLNRVKCNKTRQDKTEKNELKETELISISIYERSTFSV